jgi:heme exporter protein C
MWTWLHRLASPPTFYRFAERAGPIFGWIALLFGTVGLYGGLVLAPPDYQQGEAFRIIYVHVPSAWLSLLTYSLMAVAGAIALIWRIKLAECVLVSAAPVGASFTALALATGMLWGKPMWGAYWVWDARLTAELVLLFLYLGVIALSQAIEDRRAAARACALLAVAGVINVPIVHYSVEWWNSLHQGPTISRFDAPAITWIMLWPLLTMTLAFSSFLGWAICRRAQIELLQRERSSQWTRELLEASHV